MRATARPQHRQPGEADGAPSVTQPLRLELGLPQRTQRVWKLRFFLTPTQTPTHPPAVSGTSSKGSTLLACRVGACRLVFLHPALHCLYG